MATIYTEDSALRNRYSGIGKTISLLFSTIETIGCKLEILKSKRGSLLKEFFYYNYSIKKYCRENLRHDDIFLIPNNMGKYFIVPHSNTWVIVHDLIPLSARFGYRGIKRLLYNYKMSQLRKVSRIFTISEYVKKDLIDKIGISPDKIDVIYWPSIYSNTNLKEVRQTKEFKFLGIGTGEPRKDIEEIINFWKFTPSIYKLRLYGKEYGEGTHCRLIKLIKDLNLSHRIEVLGRISEDDLSKLYAESSGFIFSSKEEGFGLPPLEALSHATPIIIPKTPINYELYGEIGNFYSSGNLMEFLNALDTAVNDRRGITDYLNFIGKFSLDTFKSRLNL